MGKYIKKFNTHTLYETYINSQDKILPNVSLCEREDELHYNPYDYSQDYLTTVALEDGTISFNIWESMGTDMITSISYSKNNGNTWTTTNNVNNKSGHLVINISVNEGDKVLWKGNATQLGYYHEGYEDYVGSFFSSTCEFDAKGNVMSLLYGDNFKDKTLDVEHAGHFALLFCDFDKNKTCSIVDAKNLSLPSTILAESCYIAMFDNCESLTSAPKLPATTLASYCYASMFRGCTSLITAPELPAITLVNGCYNGMFTDCESLNYIKAMFITTPSTDYTFYWVLGVDSSGTFVKNSAAQWNVSGSEGVPTGWTVQTASS